MYSGKIKSFGEHDDRGFVQNQRNNNAGSGNQNDDGGSWRGRGSYSRGRGWGGRGKNNRGRGKVWNRGDRGGGGGNDPSPRTRLDADGDISMDPISDNKARYNPYQRQSRGRSSGRGGGYNRTGPINSPMRGRGNRGRPTGGVSGNRSWVRVSIPYGKKCDQAWLIKSLQNQAGVPFQPINFHYPPDTQTASFYVDDLKAGAALKECNKRITTKEGNKLVVVTKLSNPPHPKYLMGRNMNLDEKGTNILKQCMSIRYNCDSKTLSLARLFEDPDLRQHDLALALSRQNVMDAVLKIVQENIPEVQEIDFSNNRLYSLNSMENLPTKAKNLQRLNLSKNMLKTDRELDKIKGIKLEELVLDGNPLCENFNDEASYVSAVRKRFPKVIKLDGKLLPAPIGFGVEEITDLPSSKSSFFVNETFQKIVENFLTNYYNIYDSGQRQSLLEAYHEQACFSLSLPDSHTDRNVSRSFSDYLRQSRNLKRVNTASARLKLLKNTKLNVVALLNELPSTQHDLSSFTVDISMASAQLLCFTVMGVFKEVNTKREQPIRAFSRTFLAVPAADNGLCIVNDQLNLASPTSKQIKTAFATPAPTPSPSPVPQDLQPAIAGGAALALSPPQPQLTAPNLTVEHQAMVQKFSAESKMNPGWSLKCLEQNSWDYNNSAKVFLELHTQGKIPPEAFV